MWNHTVLAATGSDERAALIPVRQTETQYHEDTESWADLAGGTG